MPQSETSALPFPGLSAEEVEASRRQHGANVLTPPEREPWWKLYLEKFDDPVIRILIIAAVIAMVVGAFHGEYIEGLGILVAVLLATTLAFLNEYKANQEFDILNKVNDEVPIKVIRSGAYTTVPRKDLVVGDIVHLEVGEESPADAEIVEAVSLQADESRLTGESVPATKRAIGSSRGEGDEQRGETAYPPDRLMRGSMVVDGYGLFRLTAVGDNTEIGKTARAAAEETDEPTPLNRQLERLSKLIGVVGFGVAAGTFLALVARGVVIGELELETSHWVFVAIGGAAMTVGLVRVWLPIIYDALDLLGRPASPPGWLERDGLKGWLAAVGVGLLIFAVGLGVAIVSGQLPRDYRQWLPAGAAQEFLNYFMIAVTLIVVAVPEGLAMSVTLSLAYSMRKMTAANNLVRRMHACETIGAATVICSDKTGTLTLNEMRVQEGHFPAVDEDKLSPGRLKQNDAAARLVVEAIAGNTTANLSRKPNEPVQPLGNPTEGALLLWLDAAGIDYAAERAKFTILQQWTFTTERKFMGTLGASSVLAGPVLHVKGAPEIVLERCAKLATAGGETPLDSQHRDRLHQALAACQARGMRTLAFACRPFTPSGETKLEDAAHNLTWIGFVAIADPVRPDVPPAMEACLKAGVKVKVVTGDVSPTALEISRQIGLWNDSDPPDRHLAGREFEALDEQQAAEASQRLKVLSRARPMDKLRLVRLLKERGEVVAVTGDGTNDAPALNHADVGLAMGRTGTAVAKEASDIILLDDSFSSIVNAIRWGRSLYENIQRFILFQLTINVAALSIALLGPFLGVKFPLTVIQMLWVNLIMDTFAALALATEPPHGKLMDRPPRSTTAFIVTRRMAVVILSTAAVFVLVLIGLLLYMKQAAVEDPAWSIDSDKGTKGGTIFFSVFVLLQFWNLFNARAMGAARSAFSGLGQNRAFLLIAAAILVGQIVLVTFFGWVFRTVPLSMVEWLAILAGTSVVLWVGEIWRAVLRAGHGMKREGMG